MVDSSPPPILYKFRSWRNENHKKLLTERELWVPCAADLNDPFDCNIPFRYDLMKHSDLVERMVKIRRIDFPHAKKYELVEEANSRIQFHGIYDSKRKDEVLTKFALFYRNEHGVLSFATAKDNPLLWSHYADQYQGFCVGLRSDHLEEELYRHFERTEKANLGFWIKYVEDLPTIIPSPDPNTREDEDAFFKLLTTKSRHWSYEKEYRYTFAGQHDFTLQLEPSCFLSIILGSEMPTQDRDDIRRLMRKHFPQTQLLQARRSPTSFDLEFLPTS